MIRRSLSSAVARCCLPAMVFGLSSLAGLSGCAGRGLPATHFDEEGIPVPFKRVARHDSVDYVHHFRSKAYKKCRLLPSWFLSDDQKAIVSENGRPQYVRRPFRTVSGERIKEWAYLDQNLLFQFRGGDLVYSGPVTDMERLLIWRGYPRYSKQSKTDAGTQVQTYVYRNWIGTRLEVYQFADGLLVGSAE